MTTQPTQFNPTIGSPLLIEPVGLEDKLKTTFIGMHPGQYIIASLAPFINEIEVLAKYLERGRKARLFYTRDGVMHGYRVQLQGYTTSPLKHLYLTFPKEAESYNLREADRVVCHLPGVILGLGVNAKCLVQNLSAGGCGICLDPDEKDKLEAIELGDHLELRFQLTTMSDTISLSCQLMGLHESNGLDIAGLKFLESPEQTMEQLDQFISFVIEHRV